MQNNIVYIYINDNYYANKLSEYLIGRKDIRFKVNIYTNIEAFSNALDGEYNADICIIDELILNKDTKRFSKINFEDIGKFIILLEEDNNKIDITYINNTIKNCNYIYKYQAMSNIIKQMLINQGNKSYKISDNKKLNIISIFSTDNINNEKYCIDVANNMNNENEKNIIIDMYPFSVLDTILEKGNEYNLSDLIFYLKKSKKNLTDKIDKIIVKSNNFDFIQCVEYPTDLYEIIFDDVLKLIDELEKNFRYSNIIFLLGIYDDTAFSIIENSNKVYLGGNAQKIEKFKKLIEKKGVNLKNIESFK